MQNRQGLPYVDLNAIAWSAMEHYDLIPTFPSPVVQEVGALPSKATYSANSGLRDLRSLLWSSIDNIDSRDLDQIEVCERGVRGEIHVKVAIADVDLYVPKGSETDRHACHNTTSVYTGVETFPMLPDRLSAGLSSLLPDQDRIAIVIEYSVLPDGSTRPGGIYRAIVKNRAKLVYEEVGDWLERGDQIPRSVREMPGLAEQILLQDEAARRMKKHRTEQGALVLETIEAEPVMAGGKVSCLVVQDQNPARCLIEEFMVAANGSITAFLNNAGLPMIHRVVRIPKNWAGIVAKAENFGEMLPTRPDSRALTRFLINQKAADPDRFPDLSLAIVKLMGSGEYVSIQPGDEPVGHFALAVTDYTHGTAPNRRYVDLIIQRLIKSAISVEQYPPYTSTELSALARQMTDREKAAQKVERFVRKAAAAVMLQEQIGEIFEAFVTGASAKGVYVRTINPPAEGMVIRGGEDLQVGQRVRVRLHATDPYRGFIDFCVQ